MSHSKMNILAAAALSFSALISLPSAAAPAISFATLPTYGQPVSVMLRDSAYPMYLPATRYTRDGSTITVDYEYSSDAFTVRPDFGNHPLSLGELAPGNYTVRARLFDIGKPKSTPQTLEGNIPVMPPESYGLYTVPMAPQAWAPTDVVVKSAVYVDLASLRTSVSGSVIRLDFDYHGDAPVGSPVPAGAAAFASTALPALQPGNYRVEGWGRARKTGETARYFTHDFMVASTAQVVEFYSESLDHYFLTAQTAEIAMLDRGAQGDWKRTGQSFKGWLRASDAPPFAKEVCRFYAKGPNSHFYTGDAAECQYLRTLEQQQRTEATAQGKAFLGWQYEGVAFYSVIPASGGCPGGMASVYRSYNKRAGQNDSNHRFTADAGQRAAMSVGWADEGAAFCSPS